ASFPSQGWRTGAFLFPRDIEHRTVDKRPIFRYIIAFAFLSDLVKPALTTLISPDQKTAAQGEWR
ncbi:hypothetical protein CO174_05055, partial [Candidatus Uhrbacteria bacterium CG_4_9_14_3_um_filter_50_9]